MRFLALILVLVATAAPAETLFGRTVLITDGRANKAAAAPLVVAMHGFLGTPKSMRRKSSFDRLARANGFVAAYPQGLKRRWNDGRDRSARTDDVAYLAALIERFVSEGRADPARIFVAGHSNGGGMAMRLACDRADLVAGIAVVATKMPTNFQCPNGRAVPAIFFYGTLDPVSPPEGRPAESRLGGTLSADATLARWARRNRCNGAAATGEIDRKEDGTSVRMFRYGGCRAPLVHVSIIGHGHGWPGAGPRLPRVQGPATKEIDAAAWAWRFFSRL